MQIINSPWQKEFESFIASARKELRIAAPYYGEDTIRMILKTSKAATKCFLLKLSDHDVLAGVQSPSAVRILQEYNCTVKLGTDLHAKLLIADQQCAIVTSSNLTSRGLSGSAELGVWIDDPKIVQALVRTFDQWYARASVITDADLAKLETLQKRSKSQTSGRRYGSRILAGNSDPPSKSRGRKARVIICANIADRLEYFMNEKCVPWSTGELTQKGDIQVFAISESLGEAPELKDTPEFDAVHSIWKALGPPDKKLGNKRYPVQAKFQLLVRLTNPVKKKALVKAGLLKKNWPQHWRGKKLTEKSILKLSEVLIEKNRKQADAIRSALIAR